MEKTQSQVTDTTISQLESVNLVFDIEQNMEKEYPSYMDFGNMLSGPEMLREMGQAAVHEYRNDLISRQPWEENVVVFLKLFTSFMEKKNTPWPDASNVCMPFLTIASLQFHARAYDNIIPPKEVVRVIPTGDEDIDRAERVAKYMNFQLLYKMPGFEEGMDKTLIQLPIIGDVFRKTVFDHDLGLVNSIYCSADDVVVNYGIDSLETADRISHRLWMRPWDINRRVKKEIYASWALNLAPGTLEEGSPIKDAVDKVQGIEKPSTAEVQKPRLIIEQHRFWDIDGTGIGQPYVVTVDVETERVLRITRREYLDDTGELQQVDYFTNYVFIPNPEGFYGLGYGILIRHLNEAANTIVNEVIDAGTLANLQGGFLLKRSGLKTGKVQFERGTYKAVDANTDDIRKAVYNFDFKGPNQTLYAVLGLLYEYSKLVSAYSETMSGQMPSSDTPSIALQSIIEEGRKVFSAIHKRIHRSFKKELGKIKRLNSIYMNEREYFRVLGDNNMPTGPKTPIGRTDFVGNIDVIPVSDPMIESKSEKIGKAKEVINTTMSVPMLAQNPNAVLAAVGRYYDELGVPNKQLVLPPPPEPPDLPPEQENSGFFTEQPANVLPQQDHAHHLEVHRYFLEKDQLFSNELTAEGKKLAEMHIQGTIAALYSQEMERRKKQAMQDIRGRADMDARRMVMGG